MGKVNGIRVNALAKELGVQSKQILDKLKDEGLGDKAPNHMSVLSIGLSETVREWMAGVAGSSPAEGDSAVAVAEKTKVLRKKKATDSISDAPPTVRAEVSESVLEAESVKTEPVKPEPVADASPVQETPVTVQSEPIATPVVPTIAPPIAAEAPKPTPAPVAPPIAAETPKPAAPAHAPIAPPIAAEAPKSAPMSPTLAPAAPSIAATAAPGAPVAAKPPVDQFGRPVVNRPTITLSNLQGPTPARKPITPAPRLLTPAPAVLQGPRVVREEKPDVLPAPRPRRPMNDGPAPGIMQARPAGGRGVKVSDEDEEEKKRAAAKAARSNSQRRRGPDGRRGEANEKLREFTDADLIERRDRLNAAAHFRSGFDAHLNKSQSRGTHAIAKSTVEKGGQVWIEEPITVRTLSAALGVKTNEVMGKLVKQGIFATINQALDEDTAGTIALGYGLELHIARDLTDEEELLAEFDARESDPANLKIRPPVVTILGHVDHGKTSLLDKIRSANVAAGEAGGITQHTAAWMVNVGEGEKRKRVTFIDTPGHQAFTAMRARGANMTDVVVLVVSAAEGVQPQTIESINHARAADVPIIVALNKIDRADANPDMVLGQLAANNLNPVEWGGTTEVVRTSATTGQGINELIELLDYQAELLELKADPDEPARGTVIEARVDAGLGSIATVLVQEGTLKIGDVMLSGPGYGRIRSLWDDTGKQIKEAGPSMPVIVSGLGELPSAGDHFFIVDDLDRARTIAADRAVQTRMSQLAALNRVTTAGNLIETIKAGEVKTINLIIKADVSGSLETLVATITGQNTDEVKVRVIHSGVGAINESDVDLAIATKTKPTDNRVAIIGFHVVPEESARQLAEQNHVDFKLYRVIYEIFDDLKKSLSGMLEPEVREKLHGHAEIQKVYKFSKVGSIAGCIVRDGHIQRGSKIRLIRDGRVITQDLTIETLKRIKDDVKEVKSGLECGIKLAGYDDVKEGDVLEAYVRESFERTL